jgi:hypothetical protein
MARVSVQLPKLTEAHSVTLLALTASVRPAARVLLTQSERVIVNVLSWPIISRHENSKRLSESGRGTTEYEAGMQASTPPSSILQFVTSFGMKDRPKAPRVQAPCQPFHYRSPKCFFPYHFSTVKRLGRTLQYCEAS